MSPLALAHILTCAFACAQDSMEAPMAMTAEGTALHVGVTGLHCCRTLRSRAAESLLSDPAVGLRLSDPTVGPRFRTPPSDFLLSRVGLSHTAVAVGVACRIRYRVLFCFWVAPYNKRCNACE